MSQFTSFERKIDLTQQLLKSELQILTDDTCQGKNYRNKTIYTLNKPVRKSQKKGDNGKIGDDKITFDLIQKPHIFIIGWLNSSQFIKELKFVILDVYIKNNIRNEFQISFTLDIGSPNVSVEEDIIRPLSSILDTMKKELENACEFKITSGYYQIYGLGNTKDRTSYHFFGEKALTESLVIKVPVKKSRKFLSLQCFTSKKKRGGSPISDHPEYCNMEIEVKLSPYSFSRVNYENSLLIYNKIFQIVGEIKEIYTDAKKSSTRVFRKRVGTNSYLDLISAAEESSLFSFDIFKGGKDNFTNICFGRDVYAPFKMLDKEFGGRNYLVTHCPISYSDCITDVDKSRRKYMRLVEKPDYRQGLIETMIDIGHTDANLILTAGRNGLKRDTVEYINSEFRIKNIVYISCNRVSMAVDISGFTKFGMYKSWISDEFPGTEYNNTIVWLMRN